jgi:deazaflavin-dependent oxidoreductase (nitroreductase family)
VPSTGGTGKEGNAMMNASNMPAAVPGRSTPAVVRPSRFVRVVIGPMTKVLNPVMMRLAGRRHAMIAAQVRHVGRKSGRQYVTPVGAGRVGGTMVIPLTFGNQSDWSRNVRVAGGGTVRLGGVDYPVSSPELADWAQAAPFVRTAFNPVMRAGFRMLGIRQFLLLTLDDR